MALRFTFETGSLTEAGVSLLAGLRWPASLRDVPLSTYFMTLDTMLSFMWALGPELRFSRLHTLPMWLPGHLLSPWDNWLS